MATLWRIVASVDWVQAAPLLAVIGGLCTFVFYKSRQWNLEIEKLKLEITRMRREESLIYRPTLKEMREVFEATRSMERKGSFVGDHLGQFAANLRNYLVYLRLYYNDPYMKADIERQTKWATKNRYQTTTTYPDGNRPDPAPVIEKWLSLKGEARSRLPPETFEEVDSLLRYLMNGEMAAAPEATIGATSPSQETPSK